MYIPPAFLVPSTCCSHLPAFPVLSCVPSSLSSSLPTYPLLPFLTCPSSRSPAPLFSCHPPIRRIILHAFAVASVATPPISSFQTLPSSTPVCLVLPRRPLQASSELRLHSAAESTGFELPDKPADNLANTLSVSPPGPVFVVRQSETTSSAKYDLSRVCVESTQRAYHTSNDSPFRAAPRGTLSAVDKPRTRSSHSCPSSQHLPAPGRYPPPGDSHARLPNKGVEESSLLPPVPQRLPSRRMFSSTVRQVFQ